MTFSYIRKNEKDPRADPEKQPLIDDSTERNTNCDTKITQVSPKPSIDSSTKHKLAAFILRMLLLFVEMLLALRFPIVRYIVWSPMPPYHGWEWVLCAFPAATSYIAQRWMVETLVLWVMPLTPRATEDVEAEGHEPVAGMADRGEKVSSC